MTTKKLSRLSAPVFCPAVTVPTLEPDQVRDHVQAESVATVAVAPETADVIAERMDVLRQTTVPKQNQLPVCGVVTIQNLDWAPQKLRDIPPSLTQGLGMELSAQYAMLYNQSPIARSKRRWAVVTSRGTVLFLTGIRPEHRPANPAAFPPCVTSGMTLHEAEAAAYDSNFPRFALARVPRLWTVSLRRADCCEDSKVEGGAA